MKLLFCVVIFWPLVICHPNPIHVDKGCFVNEARTDRQVACQFPFHFKDRLHYNCIETEESEFRPWCSTKVDFAGNHVKGENYWGLCDDSKAMHCEPYLQQVPDGLLENVLMFITEITVDGSSKFFKSNMDLTVKPSLSDSGCQCSSISDCDWSSKVKRYALQFPENHFVRKRLEGMLSSAQCGNSGSVYCCKSMDLGTWKPEQSDCGYRTGFENIVGGDKASIGEFPYMALLVYITNGKESYRCGGSLINKRYVLTAAHCQGDYEHDQIKRVILGEHTLGTVSDCDNVQCAPRVQTIDVEEVIVHPHWNRREVHRGNDIALVRLKTVPLLYVEDTHNSFVAPICLPWRTNSPGRHLKPTDVLTVTGWGKVTNDPEKNIAMSNKYSAFSDSLQKLEVSSLPRYKCLQDTIFKNIDSKLMICAGGLEGQDSCNGDSGGPLTFRSSIHSEAPWYQVGIVSFGTIDCGQGQPGVYTKIVPFLDWIERNMRP